VAAIPEAAIPPRKDWRAGYAGAVLIGVLVLGFLVLTPNIYFESTPWLTLVFFAAYAVVGAAVAWRGSVRLKIAASILILAASGLAAILGGGSPANGTFFFVALVTVVTLLASPRAGAMATAITLIALAAVAALSGAGLLGVAGENGTLRAPAGWIGAALAVLLFGAALVLGISHLQRAPASAMSGESPVPTDDRRVSPPVPTPRITDRSKWLHMALETGRQLNTFHPSEDAAVGLVTAVQGVFGYPDVAVFIVNAGRDGLVLAAQAGAAPLATEQLPLEGESLAARALRSGTAQVSTPHSPPGDTVGEQGTASRPVAAVPIVWNGGAIAVLQVHGPSGGFEEDEIEALGWVASQAAAALAPPQAGQPPSIDARVPSPPPQPRMARPWERPAGEGAIEYEFGERGLPESAPEIIVPLSLRDEEIGTISLAADADLARSGAWWRPWLRRLHWHWKMRGWWKRVSLRRPASTPWQKSPPRCGGQRLSTAC